MSCVKQTHSKIFSNCYMNTHPSLMWPTLTEKQLKSKALISCSSCENVNNKLHTNPMLCLQRCIYRKEIKRILFILNLFALGELSDGLFTAGGALQALRQPCHLTPGSKTRFCHTLYSTMLHLVMYCKLQISSSPSSM